MAVIRLFLLLVVLGCLTLLLMQNWSPVLALRFLGVQSQPLPLAIWILFGVVAGAITSLFITACFKLSNLTTYPAPPRRKKVKVSSTGNRTTPRSSESYTTTTQPKTDSTVRDFNDWESNSGDDWDFAEEVQDTNKKPNPEPQDTVRDNTNYETNTAPKSSSRSGSYSYSYREPSNSGVGRTESVYDADYRVLTPPYRQTNTNTDTDTNTNTNQNKNNNPSDWGDEDWGFEDDEDWDQDDKNKSPRSGQ